MTDEPNEQAAIVPVREAQVEFYGDTLIAAEGPDGVILVPLHLLSDAMGLSWPGQRERTLRHPVLARAVQYIRVTRIYSRRGNPNALALPLDMLPGWLFGINAERVKPALRDKVIRYQEECFRVLWSAFKGDIQPAAPPPTDLNPAEQALLLAEAVAALARQHLDLEQRHRTMADYLRPFVQQTRGQLATHEGTLAAHEERLGALELRLSSGATLSEAQAAEIAGAVKAVAMLLTGAGDANGFGKVWGDLYRRYRVTAYHNLPSARYAEALAWLQGWYEELSGTGPA